jgi:histidyl-tRNA synthetase
MLSELAKLVAGNETGEAGVARLREIVEGVTAVLPAGAAERVRIEPSIARGLDYYTGLVLETTLNDLPEVGSICSGGRYDNLAELYTKEQLPGIGASLGLDRLLAAMEELKLIEPVRTPAPVFIPFFAASRLAEYQRLAAALRAAGLGVEVYPEPKKLGKQLQYADKRGFRVALVAGDDEFAAGECQLKNLANGESSKVPLAGGVDTLVAEIRRILAG